MQNITFSLEVLPIAKECLEVNNRYGSTSVSAKLTSWRDEVENLQMYSAHSYNL